MPSQHNHNYPLGIDFNFGVDSVFDDRIFASGNSVIPPMPTPGNFLLLDGTDFLLLDGTNFELL